MKADHGAIRGMRRLWVWLGVAAAVGVALGWAPLFDVLGYELAIAMSLVGAVGGLDLGAALARELQSTPSRRALYPGRSLARSTVLAAGLGVAVVVPPALIAAVRGLWVPTCDWWFGLEA